MKSILRFSLFALLLTSANSLFAQVDSLEWLYYTYYPDGSKAQGAPGGGITIDLRLKNPIGTESYFLEENKTFSFRRNNGVLTDTYYPMAGFTSSTYYTEGNLRHIRYGNNTSELNYRLMFPKNYASNPNYPNGYPMIVMIHGFGERGNCWDTNCYWGNKNYSPNVNNLNSNTIVSVAKDATSNAAVFTVSAGSHGFSDGNLVFINTGVSIYNGIKRLRKISGADNKFKISNILTNITDNSVVNFPNTNGNTTGTVDRNTATTYRITSVVDDGSGNALFTTSAPHQFVNGHSVIISNSVGGNYDGTRTVNSVVIGTGSTPTTFKLNNTSFSGDAQADIARATVYNLLNNDHSMTHGGLVHQNAINLVPNGMTPDDPAMPDRAFPGFMFYPQNVNGWGSPGDYLNALRIIRLLVKKYNIDPNRIYIHGLSDGGAGAYKLMRSAPWLFAAALPMSAVDNAQITSSNLYRYIANVPIWTFQGGVDGNPTPKETEGYVQSYLNNGINVKYTLYPTLGHGTWNTAYAEPDFFTWIRSKNKSNIQVMFGKPEVCGTSGAGVEMVLSQGFFAYQWEKDGAVIPGATAWNYVATLPGSYRARFSRKASPSESDWNRWSDPIQITESAPAKPSITALSSTVFPNINGSNNVTFKANEEAERYTWFQNGTQLANLKAFDGTYVSPDFQDTLSMINRIYSAAAGAYTLKTADFGYCQSLPSDPLYYVWDPSNTLINITAPSNFAGAGASSSSIFLSWNDNSANEKGFELWRRISGETDYKFVIRTVEDAVSYLDTGLEPGTTYEYKVRAVSNGGRSNYVPNNFTSQGEPDNLVVDTFGDDAPPTPPQNLQFTFNTINSISISWEASTDATGIKQYWVYYGADSVATGNTQTSYIITGLTLNQPYPITVRAEDNGYNLSPPSNQVIGTTFIDGLYYDHSTGAWSSLNPTTSASNGDTPPIKWTAAEFSGKIPNFNINPKSSDPNGVATQNDYYDFKFDGYLNITSSGNYKFRTTSDDGSMLFLYDFNPLDVTQNRYVNNDGQHGSATVTSSTIALPVGPVRIVVLFFEYTGGQSLTVQYQINGGSWTTIPNSMLKSGTYIPPAAPAAPTSLAAAAASMTSIDLGWVYNTGVPEDEFEVYRSLTSTGTYTLIGRSTGLAFTDATCAAGTTYYYKLKTVNDNGTSAFSNTANATTLSDTTAPSVPALLTLVSKTFSNVAFNWTASTDDVGVAGYEILINNVVADSSAVTSYMATNLAPGTLYTFTVKAYDVAGNKSAASSPLGVTTTFDAMFYSKASGALNVNTNWGTNPVDGSGTNPNFANNGQIYTVANRVSTGLGGALTIGGSVSKIIVPAGTTLDVDNILSAKIEVQGDGVVNLNNSVAPQFVSISPTSTINFNTYTTVPAGTYGNVILSGVAGNKNFAAGQVTIMGSLSVADGIALKGAPTNGSHVTIGGDITLTGTPGVVAADNALDITLVKSGTQTITLGGSLDLFKITTSAATNVNFVNGGSALTINVGSPNGGGLSIATGSSINLGNNHFVMKNAGTINAAGEMGKLGIDGGNVSLTSSSAQSSNLYFDTTLKTAGLFTSNFSSTGKLLIKSDLVITDGLKIKAGEFNAGGFVTLTSTATKTAYLQEIEGNGSVVGNVNVQRWLSAVRKYRYMSSVVANMKIADWQTYMPITGNFTGHNTNAVAASMFYYVENGGGYKVYPASGSNNQVEFGKGVGYSIFNFNTSALALQMTGNPYQGNVAYTLTPGSGGDTGWNLIGNPYASAIKWSNDAAEWSKTNVGPVVSVPDNSTGSVVFKTYDAGSGAGTLTGGIIAPGQAFWVQTSAAATLTLKEKAKRTDASWLYREGSSPEVISMVLSNGTAEDHAYVILGSDYSDTYQPETDGMKRKNDKLNLSTRSTDQVSLVFNKLEDSFCEKVVPVTIEDAAPGNYSLSFANVSNLVGVGEVTLTDNFTSTTTAVNDSEAYNFAITADAASTGTGRFKLTLNRPALVKNAITNIDNLCGGTGATVQLTNTQAGVFYYATKADGTSAITEEAIGTGGTLSLQIPVRELTAGSNSLFIRTGFKGCSNELLMANPLSFTYTPAPSIKVDDSYFSICEGSAITLRAEAGENNTFNWYKGGVLIEGQHQATLATDFIKSSSSFEVAAVTANGCEGAKAIISVEAENVPFPFVDFNGEKLVLATNISENIFVQWYKDQEPLEQYTPYLQPAEEGNYSVLVSHNGCSKISDPFQYVVTAIEPEVGSNAFAAYVYPNPATSENLYVKLETPSTQDALIEMFDLAGRKAYATLVNGAKANGVHKINFPQDTAPGLYILTIKQGNLVMQRKVMVTFR